MTAPTSPTAADAEGTAPTAGTLGSLPAAVRTRLVELRDALQRALGEDLVCLVVHGSAARGDYRAGSSDVDALLVLRDAGRARLEAVANALQIARNAARIEAMILTEAEIPRAADVFPLFYDGIKERHVVLAGRNPFDGIAISDKHRRLRIEQELREAQIRLRRIVVDTAGSRPALAGAVDRKVRQLRGPLQALLRLRGVAVSDDMEQILFEAEKAWGVKTRILMHVPANLDEALDTLTALLDKAVDDVDRREEPA